jgi:hypothetical protein
MIQRILFRLKRLFRKQNPIARLLKKRGYKWKLDHLTTEEREWAEKGVPVEGKPNVRKQAPDYFYYYKPVEGGECRIYTVGDKFYFGEGGGVEIKTADQIGRCEELSKDNAKWAAMQKSMQDTKPAFDLTVQDTKENVTVITNNKKGTVVTLKGGPLDGQRIRYDNRFEFFMGQVTVKDGESDKVIAPRYKRRGKNGDIYDYDKTI